MPPPPGAAIVGSAGSGVAVEKRRWWPRARGSGRGRRRGTGILRFLSHGGKSGQSERRHSGRAREKSRRGRGCFAHARARTHPYPMPHLLLSLDRTLRASGDSAGRHPVPEDPTALTPLSPMLSPPHPFFLFRPLFVGGWCKAACTTTAWVLGLEMLGECGAILCPHFISTPFERTMDGCRVKSDGLGGSANGPRGPRDFPIAEVF
eukprot:scaffold5983_cov137-Isochrysis_galbana.AAC.4